MAGIPDLKDVIQELRSSVSLEDYARHLGYVPDPTEGKGKTISYIKKGNGGETDKVIIQKAKYTKAGSDLYFNRKGYPEDQGDLIQFAKNRLSGSLSLRTVPSDTLEAVQRIRAFQGMPQTTKGKEIGGNKRIEKGSEERPPFKLEDFILEPLSDFTYLESRNIPKEVFLSKAFQGRIFTGNTRKVLEDYPRLKNTAFPLYRLEHGEERVVGLVLRNTPTEKFGGKIMAEGSDHESGVWVSNISPGCHRLIITESEIDALSFAAMYPKESEKSVFISTSGSIGQGQYAMIEAIWSRVRELPKPEKRIITEIVLANDNDRQGHLQDLKIIIHWAQNRPGQKEREWSLEHQVEKIDDQDYLRISVLPLSQQNKIQQLGELMSLARDFPKEVLPRQEAVLKTDTKGFKTVFRFSLTLDLERLKAFNESLLRLLKLKRQIRIQKSVGKDWNVDLNSPKNSANSEISYDTKGKKEGVKGRISLATRKEQNL